MSGLTVGGNVIPIAAPGVKRTRFDGVDRGRRFDNSYSASLIGGAARDWMFQTPPVTRALADTYETILSVVSAQTCTGDVLSIPTMCCAEITGWTPVVTAQGHSVVIDFVLHEQMSNRVLLRYTPGVTITGESFINASTRFYQNNAGVLVSVGANVKRDNHYAAGQRTTLLEGGRTNGLIRSQEFDNAAWTKSSATISANATNGPDGTATADKLVEVAAVAEHVAYQTTTTTASTVQAHSVHVLAGERTWCWLRTNLRDGTTPTSWVNLATGAVGTTAAGHTIRVTTLASSWYRIEVVVNSGVGAGATAFLIGTATADNVSSFLGDVTKGIYVWGGQHEQDAPFATSYIPTVAATVTRASDSYSMPFTTPPQEMTVYAKFIEGGTFATGSARVFQLSDAGGATPTFRVDINNRYRAYHNNTTNAQASEIGNSGTYSDQIEIMARLFGDGSVDITQSIQGATSTSAAQSSANTLATAWSGVLLWLNSGGTAGGTQGFTGLLSFKVVAGARSLAEMRVL